MWIVIELQTNKDGTVGNIVTAYSSIEKAKAKYYQICSVAVESELPVHSVVLLDNTGATVMTTCFFHEEVNNEG